jgi:hypothetical protein
MKTMVEPVDRTRWQDLVRTFQDYSYRQSWEFGLACAVRRKAACEHVAAVRGPDVLAAADVRVRRIPVLGAGIAYLNGGPLVRRNASDDAERLADAVAALIAEYVRKRGCVLRINPAPGSVEWNETQHRVFRELGFDPCTAVRPYRTFMVPIDRSLDDLRKACAHQWRTNLNHALKADLRVLDGTGPELMETFCGLYEQLLDRKEFLADLSARFYAGVQARLRDHERFHVDLAIHEDRPVSGYVWSALGDTCVLLLGASNERGLEVRASYRLLWHILQAARERNCRWYDLGGIDPEGNPGVYRFKKGLGGLDITAPGPYEFRPVGVRRYLSEGGERMVRLFQRWRAARA